MDKEKAVFQQLTLSDSKKYSSMALKEHSQVLDKFWQLKTF